MESTETLPAPVAGEHQERELIAGRYRLVSLHRNDERTEVWRALDESRSQVVSLEFLHDRDPAARERFVAYARRMTGMGPSSIVRVVGIHDVADGTFIVFEHPVADPVAHEAPEAVVEAPAPKLNAPETPILEAPEPLTVPPVASEPVEATPPEPILRPVAATEPPVPNAASHAAGERGLAGLMNVLRARDLALLDASMLKEASVEIVTILRGLKDEDITSLPVIGEALGLLQAVTGLGSSVASAGDRVRGLHVLPPVSLPNVRPSVRLPALPRMRIGAPKPSRSPRERDVRMKPITAAPAMPRAPRVTKTASAMPRVPRASRFSMRVRWRRVMLRGLTLGLAASMIIVLPAEYAAYIGSTLSTAVDQGVRTVTAAIDQGARAVMPSNKLAPASFELPPLGAYRAKFEAQAPYPTARPNATVEWVVALRNIGAAGWYRGIDGAQASLALADGTSAGVQTTPYVGPGQVGWFVVQFRAPSQPGTHVVLLHPRIDGRGALPDLGIYATVTVSPNP